MAEKETLQLENPELTMLKNNAQSAYNYRRRREIDWTETYLLYRDKVQYDRIKQRQSVNLPLMKQTIRTLLKDVDEMPVIYLENLDNDKDAEIFENEYWKYTISSECNNMEVKDIIDKRQEMLFGRTFDQMQIVNGKILITIQDPEDILVDRYTDPSDLDTARFLIHQHIFVPLSSLVNNPDYNQEAVKQMQEFYATKNGILKAADNTDSMSERNKKLSALGVPDVESPILGETYVELNIHFLFQEKADWYNAKNEKVTVEDQYIVYVVCDQMQVLMKKPLEEIIGKTKDNYWRNHLPYNSWADDVERQDFWSDGIGDIVRTPNKVLNVWFSQLVEARTFRSFGMHYFNSNLTTEGFQPPSIQPEPWGWVGLPVPTGQKMGDVFQKVEVPDMADSLDDINFLINMNDRASGATATQQGVPTQKQVTLGEVKLALSEAKERSKGMTKFYTIVWQKRAEKFLKFIEAAPDKLDAVTIYKQGRNTTDIYSREIVPGDWMTKSGYRVRIWSQEEKDAESQQQLEKLAGIKAFFPNNPKLDEILQRKALEFGKLKPDEINDIMRLQTEMRDQHLMNPQAQQVLPVQQQKPQVQQVPQPVA